MQLNQDEPHTEAKPQAFTQTGFRDEHGNHVPGTTSSTWEAPPTKDLKPVPPRPIKRIIICCDGTWQTSAHGTQTVPSNVAKMSRSIDSWYIDANGLMAPQLIYYDAGVGTAVGAIEARFLGAYGGGLDENVCEAYNFLVNNYSQGDELFFFGFSRGAYTVRACAGLVCRVGICQPDAMGQFWEMYSIYKSVDASTPMQNTDWCKEWVKTNDPKQDTFTIKLKGEDWKFTKGAGRQWFARAEKQVTIKVVGVWDTVGSLGYPDNVWVDVMPRNKPWAFHNTEIHPQIENAFHALALDEHRKSFGPTLWSLPENSRTNLIQCWFPGVHINIGGGNDDNKELVGADNEDGPKKSPTSKKFGDGVALKGNPKEKLNGKHGDLEMMSITTFFWMVDRCNPFLRFKIDPSITKDYRRALDVIAEQGQADKTGNPPGKPEDKQYGGWGIGPIIDSYQGILAAAGSETRTPGHYFIDREHTHNQDPKYHHKVTNEYMHPVIKHAIDRINYSPPALVGFKRELIGAGQGHHWVKTYKPSHPGLIKRGWSYLMGRATPSSTESDLVSIPEFVIPEPGWNAEGLYWWPYERELITQAQNRQVKGGFVPPEDQPSWEQRKVDYEGAAFLAKLDEDNKDLPAFRAWKQQRVTSSNTAFVNLW